MPLPIAKLVSASAFVFSGVSAACDLPLDPSLVGPLTGIFLDTSGQGPPYSFLVPIDVMVEGASRYETPIQMKLVSIIDGAAYNSACRYHSTALDFFGREPSERLCQHGEPLAALHEKLTNMFTFAYTGLLTMPSVKPGMDALFDSLPGLGPHWRAIQDPDYDGCGSSEPWAVAACVGRETKAYFHPDLEGWNEEGTYGREINGRPYADFKISGYSPYEDMPYSWTASWTPLLEDDGLGYQTRQEHVTPYIGATGMLFGVPESERCAYLEEHTCPDPEYKYKKELNFVLERTKLAADPNARAEIRAFDSKLASIAFQLVNWAAASGLSEFELWKLQAASAFAYRNGVTLAWREKVRWNLIRPTTIAQRLGKNKRAVSYAGPDADPIVQEINVDEWEPVVRTMPHAEYPSGSSCLCEIFAEIMQKGSGYDELPEGLGRVLDIDMSEVIPGSDVLSFGSFSEVAQRCAESRTAGGMHFSKALKAGSDLCSGVSTMLWDKMNLLEQGDSSGAVVEFDVPKETGVCAMEPAFMKGHRYRNNRKPKATTWAVAYGQA